MPTVELTTPPPPPAGLLESLPRRVSLTLPELLVVAERAGGAPLPFDLHRGDEAGAGGHRLDDRLGEHPATADEAAYAAAAASLRDPLTSLARRGLLEAGAADDGLLGAVGLLATPTTAVDLDVAAGDVRVRSWHRRQGDAVATLSTADGLVFELAWLDTGQWAGELARAAVLPDDLDRQGSQVPPRVDLPFALADGAAEAVRTGRPDLIDVLAAQHDGAVLDAEGRALGSAEVSAVLRALSTEACGRLRAMVADVSGEATTTVGVVSWTLLADGWHALRPWHDAGTHRVVVAAVEASDLAAELAPVLAEVTA